MSQDALLITKVTTKLVPADERMRALCTDYLAQTVYDQIRATGSATAGSVE